MTVNELIKELEKHRDNGFGDSPLIFDDTFSVDGTYYIEDIDTVDIY